MSFKKGSILIGSVMLLLILALSFAGALNISSFRANYTESLVGSYAVAGNDAVRNIEYAVKYGKPLNNFFDMEKILGEAKNNSPNIKNVQVIRKDGQVLYNLKGKVENQVLPSYLLENMDFKKAKGKSFLALPYENDYHVFLPLHDRDRDWIGTLDMVFDEEIISSRVAIPQAQTLLYLLIIAIIAGALLLLLYSKIDFMDEAGEIDRKRFLMVILLVFGIAQIIYASLNFSMYKDLYMDIAQENTMLTANIIQKDINSVIAKGISYEDLYQVDNWLQKVIEAVPEIDDVNIVSEKAGAAEAVAQSENTLLEGKNDLYRFNLPLAADNKGQQAGISTSIDISVSEKYIKGRTTEIALDALTVLIIAFFFMVEITIFLLLILQKEVDDFRRKNTLANSGIGGFSQIEFIRPMAFFFFLASSMAVSYIPIMMKDLYQPLFGLSKDVVLGLPISMELLCVSLSIIVTGYIIDKKGWRPPFFVGLLFLLAGSLLSGLAWNGIMFILARGVAGIGYGFSWMAMRSYCTSAPSLEEKTKGLSSYNSGIFAGFNCGIAIGAMLADRIGFSNVFFVALGGIVITAYFVYRFMEKGTADNSAASEKPEAGLGVFEFLSNPSILVFFVLLTLPLAVCSMFMDYFFPLFGASINLSTSNIGRGFLLYGLCIVYLGPYLGHYMGKILDVRRGSILSAFMTAAALIIFAKWGTLYAALAAILILGLADSFGVVAQNNYFLSLQATGQMGESKALAYYSMVRRMGQVTGPFIFGSLAVLGAGISVGMIGLACLGMLLLFILLARPKFTTQAGSVDEIKKTFKA
ncbi:MAG: MFS transporter [Syntrophomonadaceae bacterium]|nr:MFS transporter [Syntrophomonadaceae bacterium]